MGRSIDTASALLKPPKSIVNGYSTSGYTRDAVPLGSTIKKILSGSMPTAGTLYTPTGFPLVGPGVVSFLDVYENDGTSRSLRCKVTIDGAVAFDSTSTTAVGAAGRGAEIIGTTGSSVSAYIPDPMPFNTSFLVELASSNNSETNTMTVGIVYHTA